MLTEGTQRRSQEERRRLTSNKLIQATIEAVNASGYSGLKAADITRRAGVTWGAVQHLFGSKEDLLLVVANQTYKELSNALDVDVSPTGSLEERVEWIIGVTWTAFQSDAYVAMVEILRGSRHQAEFNQVLLERQRKMNDGVRRTWRQIFEGEKLADHIVDSARDLVTLTLSGLASRRIFLRNDQNPDGILSTLRDATVLTLSRTDVRPTSGKTGDTEAPLLV
ncbi:MAG: TetR/AcrR family transcriptional regulator [Pseudomonadota bacterium]